MLNDQRRQLEIFLRAVAPNERKDALDEDDHTDRGLALRVIRACKKDPTTIVTSSGARMTERSDSYLVGYALAEISNAEIPRNTAHRDGLIERQRNAWRSDNK